jgi:hypothetical protein
VEQVEVENEGVNRLHCEVRPSAPQVSERAGPNVDGSRNDAGRNDSPATDVRTQVRESYGSDAGAERERVLACMDYIEAVEV